MHNWKRINRSGLSNSNPCALGPTLVQVQTSLYMHLRITFLVALHPFTARLHMLAPMHRCCCFFVSLWLCSNVCVCIFCIQLRRIIYVCVIIHFSSINQYWLIVSVLIVWLFANFSLTHQYKKKKKLWPHYKPKPTNINVCVCANKSLNEFA